MKRLYNGLMIILICYTTISCALFKTEKSGSPQIENSERTITEQLSNSPRHHEWVSLSHGNRELQAFVVYPESRKKTAAVIVIHENRGLDDWARLFADKLAAQGYLVIAPDMISNTHGKKRTTDFENPDAARDAIYDLDPAQVTEDLDAAFAYVKDDAAATGKVTVVGFCWGGSQTFRYATNNSEISSAHVFYGTAPDDASVLKEIKAPVYGYYGGDDERVNATIEKTSQQMQGAKQNLRL
ncbi:dienelactone hydrolase family protein [Antarcticibacterium sp. 1MA-6-2]|uniref:dienelactone hydrolase family protein n=1 Tax=Antarcticibacterium sp. 1MA-6-2 TaxID=2908210 RepID=UPI001F490FA0|nr:dienelactone hydrolase family protein [Antarcticibacterium sp. 1MA-6-2]UJH91375.1 dienelactone hydrolase family protein [Antarcticibacterium sp. 1MA-6-2]